MSGGSRTDLPGVVGSHSSPSSDRTGCYHLRRSRTRHDGGYCRRSGGGSYPCLTISPSAGPVSWVPKVR